MSEINIPVNIDALSTIIQVDVEPITVNIEPVNNLTTVEVNETPTNIESALSPVNIQVATVGLQGASASAGVGGTGVSSINGLSDDISLTGVTGINVSNNGQTIYIDGSSLYERINESGSYLLGLINVSNAGVSSLNSQSGILNLTGAGNITITVNGQTLIISGNTGEYANFATKGNLELTGYNLQNQINNISLPTSIVYKSGNQTITGKKTFVDNTYFSKTGWFNDITSQEGDKQFNEIVKLGRYYSTESQDANAFINAPSHGIGFFRNWGGTITGVLGGIYAYPGHNWAGGLVFTTNRGGVGPNGPTEITMVLQADGNVKIGTGIATQKLDVNGNIKGNGFYSGDINLGDIFYNRSNYSGFITGIDTGNFATTSQITGLEYKIQQTGIEILNNFSSFTTNLISGVDSQFIYYNSVYSSVPRGISCQFENNVDNFIYSFVINGVTTSGFNIFFSDNLSNDGYKLRSTINL